MLTKSRLPCDNPLHISEAVVLPAQLPLSRDTSQNESSPRCCCCAKESTCCAFCSERISPCESFTDHHSEADHRPELAGRFRREDLLQLAKKASGGSKGCLRQHAIRRPVGHRQQSDDREVDAVARGIMEQTDA